MAAFAQLESSPPNHCCLFIFSCLGFLLYLYIVKIYKTLFFTLQYC